jgi:hypothetical protein
MRKYTVDDRRLGDHGEDFHLSAAFRAKQWIHLEDFSDETGPGGPSGPGGSWVRLWLRRWGVGGVGRGVFEESFSDSIRIGAVEPGQVLAAVGDLLAEGMNPIERVEF